VENGVVNGDANHEGEEEVPHVEAPIDNEEAENGTGEEAPASEEAGAAEDGDAPATEEEAAVAEESPATEEEGAPVEEPPAADEESPVADEVEALVEETPAAEETPEAAEEVPAEEEVAGAEDDVAAAVEEDTIVAEEQAPPEELSTVAEEEETPAEAEEAAVTEEESAPAEEVPVSDETPAVDEEAVVVEESPAEEALAAEEEAGEVEEAPAPEAEEETVVPEEGVELTEVPGELRTASGMAVATDGRHIEKLSDQLARTYIRGRPITMRIPPESRESWNPEDPLEKPPLEFQLEWVYGYRGQIDGHGNPNLYYLPTGEIVYYVAAVAVLYNLESHTQRHYTGHTNDIHCIAVHPGGPYIATGQAEGHSKISSTVQQSHVQVCYSI
jgi:hypothetical protein